MSRIIDLSTNISRAICQSSGQSSGQSSKHCFTFGGNLESTGYFTANGTSNSVQDNDSKNVVPFTSGTLYKMIYINSALDDDISIGIVVSGTLRLTVPITSYIGYIGLGSNINVSITDTIELLYSGGPVPGKTLITLVCNVTQW